MPGAQGRGGAQMGPGGRSPRAAPREQHGRGGLMPKIEVDGRPVEVPQGATVMDATNKLGVYVPYFCYHRKLSIAANCRMCLVEVEKAPKPLPACATPVTDGMKVWTHSPAAKKAQNGVMEFLLINHPLDCPICDQGGECQLQDLAVGYGTSNSRYAEQMRVLPLENEAINECWLSDKDRFSYEGVNSPDRLQRPLIRKGNDWQEVDWHEAIDFVAAGLKGKDLGVLASPQSTLEELYLAGKLGTADFRLRHCDFYKREGIPWLGMTIPELERLDRVLVIGSFPRKESPLIAHRLLQAAKRRPQFP